VWGRAAGMTTVAAAALSFHEVSALRGALLGGGEAVPPVLLLAVVTYVSVSFMIFFFLFVSSTRRIRGRHLDRFF